MPDYDYIGLIRLLISFLSTSFASTASRSSNFNSKIFYNFSSASFAFPTTSTILR
jgi:hypothetical protein